MPTVKVLRSFRDAKTGEVHKRGDKLSITMERLKEIQSVDDGLIEAPAKKAPAKKAAAKAEPTDQDSESSKTE